jgi:hypothetical protein
MKTNRAEENKRYREKNREEIAAKRRAWRVAHKEEIKSNSREYYVENQDVLRAKKEAYRLANREEINRRQRAGWWANRKERLMGNAAYYATHKEEMKAVTRKRKYGLSQDDFNAMLEKQGMACAVCHKNVWPGKRLSHIDHDHKTGKVRGILCSHCNTALGLMNDSLDIIKAMEGYVRKNQKGDDE